VNRVLITGAGGFVGSHLALGLAKLGFVVVASDQHFDAAATARLHGLERLTCDVQGLARQLGPVDSVIHGAAVTADPSEVGMGAAAALADNLRLTLEALTLAEARGAGRLILLSSAGVFSGAHPGPLDETAPPDATGLYATAKRMGELAAQSVRIAGGPDAVSVRLGNLYGPDETPRATRPRIGLLARMVKEAREEGTITVTAPGALREWTHVADLAHALGVLLQHPAPPDVTHLCAPSVVTDLTLAKQVQGLVPGTRLEVQPDATTVSSYARVRPPLSSSFSEALGLTHWRTLETGLAQLVRAEVPT
jgi:UDP-glucose 4-epimerase